MRVRMATGLLLTGMAMAAVAAGCSSSDDGTSTPPPAVDSGTGDAGITAAGAEADFWTAYHAGDYDRGRSIIDEMQAVHAAHPEDIRNTELLGLTSLWQLSESPRTHGPPASDVAQLAGGSLGEVHAKDPSNLFAQGFLGIILNDQGEHQNDADMRAQAASLIDPLTTAAPYYGLFFSFFRKRNQPAKGAEFASGVDDMWKLFDACIGGTLDRDNPDYTPYLHQATAEGDARFCWDTDKAPHSLEGMFLYMGDALVKLGKTDVAKVFYQNTRVIGAHPILPGARPWLHADAVDARLASDLEARHAAYANADPQTWPPLGDAPYNCTQCHGTTGK